MGGEDVRQVFSVIFTAKPSMSLWRPALKCLSFPVSAKRAGLMTTQHPPQGLGPALSGFRLALCILMWPQELLRAFETETDAEGVWQGFKNRSTRGPFFRISGQTASFSFQLNAPFGGWWAPEREERDACYRRCLDAIWGTGGFISGGRGYVGDVITAEASPIGSLEGKRIHVYRSRTSSLRRTSSGDSRGLGAGGWGTAG